MCSRLRSNLDILKTPQKYRGRPINKVSLQFARSVTKLLDDIRDEQKYYEQLRSPSSMLNVFSYLVNGAGYSLIVSSVSVPQRSIWVTSPDTMAHALYCGRRIES